MGCRRFNPRYRITIQEGSVSDDGYGGRSRTWATKAQAWAEVIPLSGREVFTSQQLESRVTHRFIIRYQSALKISSTTAAYQVLFDGRKYNIRFIRNLAPDMKAYGRAFQEIVAEENHEEA